MQGTFSDRKHDCFWQILECSNRDLRTLCRTLEALSQQELVAYQDVFEDAKSAVNPCLREELGKHLEECSEDAAADFAVWVVGQGKAFYETVRNNPDAIKEYWAAFENCEYGNEKSSLGWNIQVDRSEYRGAQSPAIVAYAIYRRRFGKELFGP